MKLTLDTEAGSLTRDNETVSLYSPKAFAILSEVWVRTGWALRHSYSFTWLGRPVIQLPEDLLRIQEVIWQLRPDVVVETGVAHGGSLIFYATILHALGKGEVVGVDLEIRPHNRAAIEAHPLARLISLVEGDSKSTLTVERVRTKVPADGKTLVILDSNHSRDHVLAEIRAYAPLVSVGCYLVVTDGVMRSLWDVPGGKPSWKQDNPCSAIDEFLATDRRFRHEVPARPFDESQTKETPTHWPNAYLRRVEP